MDKSIFIPIFYFRTMQLCRSSEYLTAEVVACQTLHRYNYL